MNENSLGIDDDYFYELIELIDGCEVNLLDLEKRYDDTSVKEINRILHSLKGNCGMLSLFDLESIFHRIENEFLAQSEQKSFRVDLFLNAIDILKIYVHNPTKEKISEILALFETQKAPSKGVEESAMAESVEVGSTFLNVFHLDDDEDVLEAMRFHLSSFDCDVKSFLSHDKMKERILKGDIPDLFIIDYKMPLISGTQVITALNGILPRIPKILLSGYVNKDIVVEAVNKGAIGVLEKPVDNFSLGRVLRRVRDFKYQNIITRDVYSLCMKYERLSSEQIREALGEIKSLISKRN